MKTLFSFLIVLALTGCAETPHQRAHKEIDSTEKVTDYPELNAVVTHGFGEKIVAKSVTRIAAQAYLEVVKPTEFEGGGTKCNPIVMPTKVFRQGLFEYRAKKRVGCFGPVNYKVIRWCSLEDSEGGPEWDGNICVRESGTSLYIWTGTYFVRLYKYDLKKDLDHIRFSNDMLPRSINSVQILIYEGRVGNNIKLHYISRATQETDHFNLMQFDISESSIIEFQSLRLEVLNADNSSITYKLLRNFPVKKACCVETHTVEFEQSKAQSPSKPSFVSMRQPHEPEMVLVPGGSFNMGSEEGEDYEIPVHGVRIASFELGKYEVTRSEFRAFVEATGYRTDAEKNSNKVPSSREMYGCTVYEIHNGYGKWEGLDTRSWRDPGFPQTDDHPVTCVSWNDAQAYIAWLNRETGKEYRLPTEAEWEYAARAGSASEYSFGNSTSELCSYGNVWDQKLVRKASDRRKKYIADCSDGHVYTAPVGSYKQNNYGLKDMHGNVMEWLSDCDNPNYIGAPSDGSAWLSYDCDSRVLRGGSWFSGPFHARSASRDNRPCCGTRNMFGFRLARTR